jgi:serine/threonine protein kinase
MMDNWSEVRESLGRYQIVRELGSGATGTVFLAKRIQDFDQTVALKVLRWMPVKSEAHDPIANEHIILRSLEHPNIVALLDHGIMANGAPFLVLEYLNGTTMSAWCDSHHLAVGERLTLLRQVFSAVAYAHSRLVLHGDIKPANVMVIPSPSKDSPPIVKLLDFGISRWMHESRSAVGLTGATAAYASPEQRRGDALTVATDIFALGVLMRSLLSGVEAASLDGRKSAMSVRFQSLDLTLQQEIASYRATTPQALSQVLRGPLDAIIEKATASEPEDRYASVAAMADDLKRYEGKVETSVYPLRRAEHAMLWMQRHALLTGLTMMMFVILLTGGSLTLWRHHRVVLQERATHARLLEITHLTNDLSGELYRSTRSLAGSEQARKSLLRAAATARDAVAQENDHDPDLSLELAQQYEAAAEMRVTQSDKDEREKAAREIRIAGSLLKFVPNSKARSELAEKIGRLQTRVSTSSF